jgi:hypothetical protein
MVWHNYLLPGSLIFCAGGRGNICRTPFHVGAARAEATASGPRGECSRLRRVTSALRSPFEKSANIRASKASTISKVSFRRACPTGVRLSERDRRSFRCTVRFNSPSSTKASINVSAGGDKPRWALQLVDSIDTLRSLLEQTGGRNFWERMWIAAEIRELGG